MSALVYAAHGIQARYAALTFATKPPLVADGAPLKNPATGVALTPPFVVLRVEDGGPGEWMGEGDRVEVVRATFDVYAPTRDAAAVIAAGICYDGDPPNERHGMDDADALTLPAGYVLNKLERQGPGRVLQDRKRGPSANLEYQISLVYLVEIVVNGDGA